MTKPIALYDLPVNPAAASSIRLASRIARASQPALLRRRPDGPPRRPEPRRGPRPPRDLATFARLATETGKRQGVRLPGVAYYQAALEIFGPSDEVRLYLADHEGDTLGGIIVFRFGKTAYYLFGGSGDRKRELMPNYLLHWHAMLDFRAMGCDTYDWWGIPEEPAPDHPWFGLYRFKTGFGGETVRYVGLYEHVLRSGPLKLERRLQQLKAKIG